MVMAGDRTQREQDKFYQNVGSQTSIKVIDGVEGNQIRFDPDDEYPEFIGVNESADAFTSGSTWAILKFHYTGTATGTVGTKIERRQGSWDERLTYF